MFFSDLSKENLFEKKNFFFFKPRAQTRSHFFNFFFAFCLLYQQKNIIFKRKEKLIQFYVHFYFNLYIFIIFIYFFSSVKKISLRNKSVTLKPTKSVHPRKYSTLLLIFFNKFYLIL